MFESSKANNVREFFDYDTYFSQNNKVFGENGCTKNVCEIRQSTGKELLQIKGNYSGYSIQSFFTVSYKNIIMHSQCRFFKRGL